MINKKFNAALIQLNSSCNVEENLSAITSFVREASEKAQLIILPEHSDAVGKNEADFAHPLPGEISRFFSSLAKKYSVFLHCGSTFQNTKRRIGIAFSYDRGRSKKNGCHCMDAAAWHERDCNACGGESDVQRSICCPCHGADGFYPVF